jgi:hypothetical protein
MGRRSLVFPGRNDNDAGDGKPLCSRGHGSFELGKSGGKDAHLISFAAAASSLASLSLISCSSTPNRFWNSLRTASTIFSAALHAAGLAVLVENPVHSRKRRRQITAHELIERVHCYIAPAASQSLRTALGPLSRHGCEDAWNFVPLGG